MENTKWFYKKFQKVITIIKYDELKLNGLNDLNSVLLRLKELKD